MSAFLGGFNLLLGELSKDRRGGFLSELSVGVGLLLLLRLWDGVIGEV
jgi:hypothetical protein